MQGIYRNDERDGLGLLSYADGRSDVGLWKQCTLVRIASTVDSPFSLSELGYDSPPGSQDRPVLRKKRVPRSRREKLNSSGVDVALSPFEYPWSPGVEELAAAVLRDFLPPTSNAADMTALDEAYIAEDCVTFGAVKEISKRRPSLRTSLASDSRRFSLGSQSRVLTEHGSDIGELKTAGEAGAVDKSGSGKLHTATPPDSALARAAALRESVGLPAIQQPSPNMVTTSRALNESTAAERAGHKQPVLPGSSPAKDGQLAHSGSTGLQGVQQPPAKVATAIPRLNEFAAADGTGPKQPTSGSSPAKADTQAAHAESTLLPGFQEPSPKVASTSSELGELAAADRTGPKQPTLDSFLANAGAWAVHAGSTRLPGVKQLSPKVAPAIRGLRKFAAADATSPKQPTLGSSPAKAGTQAVHAGSTGLPGVQQPSHKVASASPGLSEFAATDGTGQKQPTLGSSPAKAGTQAVHGTGLPGVEQHPSPKVASTSPGLGELTQVEESGQKQPSSSTPKFDAQQAPGRLATSSGISDSSRMEGGSAAMANSKSSTTHRLAQSPMTVLAGIEAVLRGQPSSEAAELNLDAGRSGPLQLMSERFINAAGRGDVEAVGELLDGGLVSPDVADSSGMTAVLAAAVRIAL